MKFTSGKEVMLGRMIAWEFVNRGHHTHAYYSECTVSLIMLRRKECRWSTYVDAKCCDIQLSNEWDGANLLSSLPMQQLGHLWFNLWYTSPDANNS